jgi:hypothetical protein
MARVGFSTHGLTAVDGSTIDERSSESGCRVFHISSPGSPSSSIVAKHFCTLENPSPEDLAAGLAWLVRPTSGDAASDLAGKQTGSAGIVVCGVDTESAPTSRGSTIFTVQLIQLCVGCRVVLIERATGLFASDVLRAFFRNADGGVIFTGAELAGDAVLLLAHGLPMNGGLDLTPTYSGLDQAEKTASGASACSVIRGDGSASPRVLLAAESKTGDRSMGLKRMFERWYGVTWEKRAAVSCSDWAAGALSLEQIKYAVLDAWVSARMGWHAIESWGSQVRRSAHALQIYSHSNVKPPQCLRPCSSGYPAAGVVCRSPSRSHPAAVQARRGGGHEPCASPCRGGRAPVTARALPHFCEEHATQP